MNKTKLKAALQRRGFNINDVPYTPIHESWERLPIIKALRSAGKEAGTVYKNIRPLNELTMENNCEN